MKQECEIRERKVFGEADRQAQDIVLGSLRALRWVGSGWIYRRGIGNE